ncbi:discoidin domain-containing protein [Adlercreutzia sp. ZJ141]|uniref:discoidin domain-containing protein n=1 Tax=Adlercreutzia sp. ZJ141 TaxID=2709406 RepID=UPI0013EBE602|nr:PASTA domain-containing protein [Adlercreutzia sp. ZJ141]
MGRMSKESSSLLIKLTVIVSCLAIALLASRCSGILPFSNKEAVEVPDVVELMADEARDEIEHVGLASKIGSQEYSSEVPEGRGISQSPSAGKKVSKGTTVEFVVSEGVEPSAQSAQPVVSDDNEDTEVNASESVGGNVAVSSGSGAVNYGYSGMTHASATSYLMHDNGNNTSTYYPSNAIDGTLQYCWAESSGENGSGQSITLSADQVQTIAGMVISSGYQKSSAVYYDNARPQSIGVYADGNYVGSYNLSDAGITTQTITFETPVNATSITVSIESVYPGKRYNDCCISEISFFGI